MSNVTIVDLALLEKQSKKTERMAKRLIVASQKTDMEYYTAAAIITGMAVVVSGMAMKFNAPDLPNELQSLYHHIHDGELLAYVKSALTVSHDLTSDNVTGNGLALLAAGGTAKVFSAANQLARNCIKLSKGLLQQHTQSMNDDLSINSINVSSDDRQSNTMKGHM